MDSVTVFQDVLQELIDLHEQTRCGCGYPYCSLCRIDEQVEDTISKGLRADKPLNNQEREQFEALKKMFQHTFPDKFPDTYFVSGEAGYKDESGLPEYVSICPAYGVGYSVLYRKEEPNTQSNDFTPVTKDDIIWKT